MDSNDNWFLIMSHFSQKQLGISKVIGMYLIKFYTNGSYIIVYNNMYYIIIYEF